MAPANGKATQSTWREQANLPNALTLLRLVLVPVFLWFLITDTPGYRWAALAIFVGASYTDMLDGQLARARNLVTTFGKLADPLADKFLTLGAFVALSWLGELPWWFTIIVAVREVGITILREVLRQKGIVVAASSGGKLKTVLQMLLIFLMVLPWASFAGATVLKVVWIVIWIVAALALVVTVWSGVQYVSATAKSLRDHRE